MEYLHRNLNLAYHTGADGSRRVLERGASPLSKIYPLPFTNPQREGGQGDRSPKPKIYGGKSTIIDGVAWDVTNQPQIAGQKALIIRILTRIVTTHSKTAIIFSIINSFVQTIRSNIAKGKVCQSQQSRTTIDFSICLISTLKQVKPSTISTVKLRILLPLHLPPIKQVVYLRSYPR